MASFKDLGVLVSFCIKTPIFFGVGATKSVKNAS
jgi:hypothetical protein